MRKRIQIQECNLIEQSMKFGDELLSLCRIERDYDYMDSLSYSLVVASDRYIRPVTAALALTMLRFSDLSMEVMYNFLKSENSYVRQNKTSVLYQIKPLSHNSRNYARGIDIPTLPFHASYATVRNGLNRIVSRELAALLSDHNTSLHIFRHIRASYLFSRGNSYSDIGAYLGHSSDDSCRPYVHDNVINTYFSTN